MTYGGTEQTNVSFGAGVAPWTPTPPVTPDATHDAVIVVPGIMGSALRDTTTGRWVWGLRDLRWVGAAWRHEDGMQPLHLDDDERSGRYDRIEATELLRAPVWAPFLKGIEPYDDLLDAVREVAHPKAVREFPYDWRLPVAVNGARLAEAAHEHLAQWRASEEHARARRSHPDEREARLVFVAHSMGGLVTRAAFAHAASQGSGLAPETRAVVTLGTPFLGSAKAAVILNGDRSGRLPARLRRRMQALSATLPGVHDLLPDYRCVDAGLDVHRLTPTDVAALGGDAELAREAQEFQQRMREKGPELPGHRAVVGVAQPTVQSLRLDGGVVHEQYISFERNGDGELARDRNGVPRRRDRAGDGTVYRDAASFAPTMGVTPLPLQHGALAKDSVAIAYVRAVLTEHDQALGPALGEGDIGLDVPDCVEAGRPWLLRLRPGPGSVLDTYAGITCTVHDAETGLRVATGRLGWHDGGIGAWITLPVPGLYRIRISTGGNAPVTQLVLALDPDDD
ncbi:esterase/lipase family protein [Streptomyces kaempferi]|uniref:esterase/lipase family protein n=1 Tax=Streptomyces kaempferi TaxID=333725 RepID=UPI003609435C